MCMSTECLDRINIKSRSIMEFPDLGQNCANKICKQLDFLPMKCDACSQIFCKDHIQYTNHSCPDAYKRNNQVPVCPLCSKPIPLKAGQVADVQVDLHISSDCQSDPAKERRKVYTNRCSKKGCKVKEMVSVTCDRCSKNYCLKHRHENDHECSGSRSNSPASHRARAAQAAIARSKQNNQTSPARAAAPQQTLLNSIGRGLAGQRASRAATQVPVGNFQAGMSEQEALEQALRFSAADTTTATSSNSSQSQQEADDLALAQAIAASEREARNSHRNTRSSTDKKSSCSVS